MNSEAKDKLRGCLGKLGREIVDEFSNELDRFSLQEMMDVVLYFCWKRYQEHLLGDEMTSSGTIQATPGKE